MKDTIFENTFQITYNKLSFKFFKCDKGQKAFNTFLLKTLLHQFIKSILTSTSGLSEIVSQKCGA